MNAFEKIAFIVWAIAIAGCNVRESAIFEETPILFDKYGGIVGHEGHNTSGYFQVEKIKDPGGDRWWFVDPLNNIFYSLGSNSTNPGGDWCPALGYSLYGNNVKALFSGNTFAWADRVIDRYSLLKFNTLGSWSASGIDTFQNSIPYVLNLNLGSGVPCPRISKGFWSDFPDVFDPCFAQKTAESARSQITEAIKNNHYLIGYFTDNEISWWGGSAFSYNPDHTLADDAISNTATSAIKQYWVNTFLKETKGYTLQEINSTYGKNFTDWSEVLDLSKLPNDSDYPAIQKDKDDFIGVIADAYFSATTSAIKDGAGDKNHLILGCRFAVLAPDQVIEAAGKYVDVISVNDYFPLNDPAGDSLFGKPLDRWSRIYSLTNRPSFITEYGRKGKDSGLPNTQGAGWPVLETQEDRAKFERETIDTQSDFASDGTRFIIGFHWFEWRDEPALGRFDGENSNYGVVNIKDELYTTLAQAFRNTHDALYRKLLHLQTRKLYPPTLLTPASQMILQTPWPRFSWSSVSRASSYTLLYSPDRTFPDAMTLSNTISGTSLSPEIGMASGTWWWTVKANTSKGISSDYATPESFVIAPTQQDPVQCMALEDLSCWKMEWPASSPDRSNGSAAILPDESIMTQGEFSARMVFTINSYGTNNKVNGGPGGKVSLSWIPIEPLDFESKTYFQIDIMPGLIALPSGAVITGLTYLRIVLKDSAGYTITDASLDPGKAAISGEWTTVSIPLSGSTKKISSITFYMNINDQDIPLDQRMTFYLDNIR